MENQSASFDQKVNSSKGRGSKSSQTAGGSRDSKVNFVMLSCNRK